MRVPINLDPVSSALKRHILSVDEPPLDRNGNPLPPLDPPGGVNHQYYGIGVDIDSLPKRRARKLRERRSKITSLPDQVTFEVGQPMGMVSSWATYSLWHHCVLHYCAHAVSGKEFPTRDCPQYNVFEFVKYLLLGDDITI